jgi:hypothetical protein
MQTNPRSVRPHLLRMIKFRIQHPFLILQLQNVPAAPQLSQHSQVSTEYRTAPAPTQAPAPAPTPAQQAAILMNTLTLEQARQLRSNNILSIKSFLDKFLSFIRDNASFPADVKARSINEILRASGDVVAQRSDPLEFVRRLYAMIGREATADIIDRFPKMVSSLHHFSFHLMMFFHFIS